MPFTLDDLDRIRVRMGMSTKSLRQLTDTQFTAWLRAQGARGDIGVIKVGPGELVIPIEERVRVLNDLDREGFYIEGIMGTPPEGGGIDPALLTKALEHLNQARTHLESVEGIISEVGEIDPRVNMRVSIHGALELVELLRGAVEHGPRGRMGTGPIP